LIGDDIVVCWDPHVILRTNTKFGKLRTELDEDGTQNQVREYREDVGRMRSKKCAKQKTLKLKLKAWE
jgi:hypothetical protein